MSRLASPALSSSRSASRMAGVAGTIRGIIVTADGKANRIPTGPLEAGLFYLARCRMLWHRKASALGDGALCPHHILFIAGDFLMRRSFMLAGAAAAVLVASFAGAHAQQP